VKTGAVPQIKNNEHVFTCGMTGSGKSVLNKVYLAGYPNVICLDTKGDVEWDEAGDIPIFDELADLIKFGEGKAIYRPRFEELNTEYYEKFFEWVYYRMNTIVWIDEIMSISDNAHYIPKYAKAILTRGRSRNTAIWGATQRPKTIPLVYMSEASHFFIFRLNLEADRKRVMEIIPHEEINQMIPPFKFWYYNHRLETPIKAQLKLN
jgi:hypothetical protein